MALGTVLMDAKAQVKLGRAMAGSLENRTEQSTMGFSVLRQHMKDHNIEALPGPPRREVIGGSSLGIQKGATELRLPTRIRTSSILDNRRIPMGETSTCIQRLLHRQVGTQAVGDMVTRGDQGVIVVEEDIKVTDNAADLDPSDKTGRSAFCQHAGLRRQAPCPTRFLRHTYGL
mmetsp:Transcript_32363/g.126867  ORF Transcript_32363/g.126867 Transcript_32363/m.126867 type:complete len:174 (+) Transcript_32363:3247-3768(+)